MEELENKGHGSHTGNLSLKHQNSQELTEKPLDYLTFSGSLPPSFSVYSSTEGCSQELTAKFPYNPIYLGWNCHRIIMVYPYFILFLSYISCMSSFHWQTQSQNHTMKGNAVLSFSSMVQKKEMVVILSWQQLVQWHFSQNY